MTQLLFKVTNLYIYYNVCIFFSINILLRNLFVPIWFIISNSIHVNSLFSIYFLSQCIKLPFLHGLKGLNSWFSCPHCPQKPISIALLCNPAEDVICRHLSFLFSTLGSQWGVPTQSEDDERWEKADSSALCGDIRIISSFITSRLSFFPPSWR